LNSDSLKILYTWALLLSIGIFIFVFVHECGHGFGFTIDGIKVSTGFNKVGDPGKKPQDPDFRSSTVIKGGLTSGSLLGPFLNWIFAIVFTAALLLQKKAGKRALILASAAVSNAILRFVPMLGFFIAAATGRFILEDEVGWGLRSIQGLEFPMSHEIFRKLSLSQPEIFLSEPRIYFWSAVSLLISVACLILAYRHLISLYKQQISSHLFRWSFVFMPLAVWPFILIAMNFLDRNLRINW